MRHIWAGARRSVLLAGLLLLVHVISTSEAMSCTTCEFYPGQAVGALDFGLNGELETSIILSKRVSQAIKVSATPLSFTVEAWVWAYDPALRRPQPLFARYPRTSPIQGDSQAEFLLQLEDNGNLNLFFGSRSSNQNRRGFEIDCGFDIVPAQTWTHLALTVFTPAGRSNPTDVRLYKNGELACGWNSSVSAFDGSRPVLHDQPFAFSNYQAVGVCEGEVQTFNGRMDEIRVWIGARSPQQVRSFYDTVVPTSPNLVARLALDRTPEELDGYYAADASRLAAPGAFFGVNGQLPEWMRSRAPIEVVVEVDNFQIAPFSLPAYSANPLDSWAAVVDTSMLESTDSLYRDATGNIPLGSEDMVQILPGNRYPVVYVRSLSPIDKEIELTYKVVSMDANGDMVESDNATITVLVYANGCDGKGGQFDGCGVCNGNDRCPPFGCDQLGNVTDRCNICNGAGDTCACAITEWRGYTTRQLDNSVLFGDLTHLNNVMTETQDLLDEVAELLLAGEEALTCPEYTEALTRVRRLQRRTETYNSKFVSFLNRLD